MLTSGPHRHRCAGCGRLWPCGNRVCTDIHTQVCRICVETQRHIPEPVRVTAMLEAAGHDLWEAAYAFRRAGESDIAEGLCRVRETVLQRIQEIAVAHGVDV